MQEIHCFRIGRPRQEQLHEHQRKVYSCPELSARCLPSQLEYFPVLQHPRPSLAPSLRGSGSPWFRGARSILAMAHPDLMRLLAWSSLEQKADSLAGRNRACVMLALYVSFIEPFGSDQHDGAIPLLTRD